MAGYMGIMEFIKSYKRGHDGTKWKLEAESLSLFWVLLKLMLTGGKGRTW
jgi:hypothetical protein